jgi:ATP-dependent exoDNAse (exonuclease V) alpha subunit
MLLLPAGKAAKRMQEATLRQASTTMVDVPLLAWLLRSVGPRTRLIFVGDKDQLPSVGPGSVLRDLVACERIPVRLLTVIKGEGSPIVEAAHAINRGVHAQRLIVESTVRLDASACEQAGSQGVGGQRVPPG